jgi:hypothetical protein
MNIGGTIKLSLVLRCVTLLAISFASLSHPANAETLTGIVVFSANLGGSATGGQAWNTVGGDSWYNVYLATGGFPSGSPLLNSGNGATTSISIPLAPGIYNYTLWGASNGDHGQPNFGINLFFNGNTATPGISAFSPEAFTTSPTSASANNGTTLTMVNNFGITTPGSNSLTFGNVTLTGFNWYDPNVYKQNMVSAFSDTGGWSGGNFVGNLSLDVSGPSTVPEPGTVSLFGCGLVGLWLKRRQQRNSMNNGNFVARRSSQLER